MTIQSINPEDITSPKNKHDIVIGMNSILSEPSALGRRVLGGKSITRDLTLGDVITFDFDPGRKLHMIICHHIGKGGWAHAEKYIRTGLDYLWHSGRDDQQFSIVRIGTGLVGRRDGADAAAIHSAMATSYAPLHLFVWDPVEQIVARAALPPLRPLHAWNIAKGERRIRMAA